MDDAVFFYLWHPPKPHSRTCRDNFLGKCLEQIRWRGFMGTSNVERCPDFKVHSPELTANAPETRPKPKRKRESIPTIHFQVLLLLVSGRVCLKLTDSKVPNKNYLQIRGFLFGFSFFRSISSAPPEKHFATELLVVGLMLGLLQFLDNCLTMFDTSSSHADSLFRKTSK